MNIRRWGREHQAAKSIIIKSNDCDILSINETWIKDDNDSIDIEGYQWYGHRRRTVNRRAVKGSGGVGVLVANHLFPLYDIEITDKGIDGILALSLSNKVTNYKLMLITAYLPPDNSIYGRDSSMFFSHLINLIYLTSDYDAVYVAGDLNGRIGNRLDFIEQLDDVPTRTAIDQSVKGHGEAILDFVMKLNFVSSMVALILLMTTILRYWPKALRLSTISLPVTNILKMSNISWWWLCHH